MGVYFDGVLRAKILRRALDGRAITRDALRGATLCRQPLGDGKADAF
jgi:hypothetical protein